VPETSSGWVISSPSVGVRQAAWKSPTKRVVGRIGWFSDRVQFPPPPPNQLSAVSGSATDPFPSKLPNHKWEDSPARSRQFDPLSVDATTPRPQFCSRCYRGAAPPSRLVPVRSRIARFVRFAASRVRRVIRKDVELRLSITVVFRAPSSRGRAGASELARGSGERSSAGGKLRQHQRPVTLE
jgi:hypothetical protein